MSQLTRFNNNLFNDFFGDLGSHGYFVSPLHGESLSSNFKVDIKDSDNSYVFQAELPGIRKEDLHVTVDGSTVTIAAEIKQHDEQTKDEKVVRSERYFGSVSRSFQLPVDVDQNTANASYENGVLQLTLPKKLNVAGKRIEIL
ncbi:Hsp20/alpha crystallin family protein [Methylotenera versatilis]|uniref:Heat shock protein Hsp20 n=1 Tax=Methylotenera versatilis (strain 301) TaxID=666681 RepID=D7DKK5_METV0|nr:Hsp20/alpha crystallin family protein [Methylotenera versatilis]ADI30451.1 heat shock protein Hsp20 [Methylotenera versatilis 301]